MGSSTTPVSGVLLGEPEKMAERHVTTCVLDVTCVQALCDLQVETCFVWLGSGIWSPGARFEQDTGCDLIICPPLPYSDLRSLPSPSVSINKHHKHLYKGTTFNRIGSL